MFGGLPLSWVSHTSVEDFAQDEWPIIARTSGGEESVVVRSAHHIGHFQMLELCSVLYVEGDEFGLQASGFTRAAAKAEAGIWISVQASMPSQAAAYQELSDPVTVSSITAGLRLTGPLSEPHRARSTASLWSACKEPRLRDQGRPSLCT